MGEPTSSTAIGAIGMKMLAAVAGAMLAAVRSSALPMRQRVMTFFGGFLAATFLTDSVMAYFQLPVGPYEHGIAFVLGLFGMLVFEAFLTLDWRALINRKVGGGGA